MIPTIWIIVYALLLLNGLFIIRKAFAITKRFHLTNLFSSILAGIDEYMKAKNKEEQKFYLSILSSKSKEFSEILSYSKFKLWIYQLNNRKFLQEHSEIHNVLSRFIEDEAQEINHSWSIKR